MKKIDYRSGEKDENNYSNIVFSKFYKTVKSCKVDT